MHKHFLTFAFLLVLNGCKEEKIPEHILGIEKMAAVLIDIHLAEGKVEELALKEDTAAIVFSQFESEIFEKHAVDPEIYKESFTYHLKNMVTMDQIYSIVVDSLNVRRQVSNID